MKQLFEFFVIGQFVYKKAKRMASSFKIYYNIGLLCNFLMRMPVKITSKPFIVFFTNIYMLMSCCKYWLGFYGILF